MQALLQFLRCSSFDDCVRIQSGHLNLRRFGRWMVLFTIGISLAINDQVGAYINHIVLGYEQLREDYNEATGNLVYKWTIGWVVPVVQAPKIDDSAIALYKVFNGLQLALLFGCCLYSLRWIYADYRVQANLAGFKDFCQIALFANIGAYVLLKACFAVLL